MQITVLLFGPQAAIAGAPSLSLELQADHDGEPIKAAALLRAIADQAPELTPSLPASRLAINHEFVRSDATVRAGDEVALIGMVSGG